MEQRDDYRGNYFLLLVSKNQTFVTKIFLVKPCFPFSPKRSVYRCLAQLLTDETRTITMLTVS